MPTNVSVAFFCFLLLLPVQVFARPVVAPNRTTGSFFRDGVDLEARAVVLFNRGESPTSINVSWAELEFKCSNCTCTVRDLWAHRSHGATVGAFAQGYGTVVAPHAVSMLKVVCPKE